MQFTLPDLKTVRASLDANKLKKAIAQLFAFSEVEELQEHKAAMRSVSQRYNLIQRQRKIETMSKEKLELEEQVLFAEFVEIVNQIEAIPEIHTKINAYYGKMLTPVWALKSERDIKPKAND